MPSFVRNGETYIKVSMDVPERVWIILTAKYGRGKSKFVVDILERALGECEVEQDDGVIKKFGEIVEAERKAKREQYERLLSVADDIISPEELVSRAVNEIEWIRDSVREIGLTEEIVGVVGYYCTCEGVELPKRKIRQYLRKELKGFNPEPEDKEHD